jgi:arylsulfatase A-like enzyme
MPTSNGPRAMAPRRRRLLLLAAGLGVLVAGGLVAFFATRRAGSDRPNVLLITVDSLRPDRLGCYGRSPSTSPTFDALARKGVLFTEAIAQSSWTLPSVYSLMTGSYPSRHGVFFWDLVPPEGGVLLPRLLAGGDYDTAFFSSHVVLPSHGPLAKAFVLARAESDDATLVRDALAWMAKEATARRPFFLWLHLMDVHDSKLEVPKDRQEHGGMSAEERAAYLAKYDAGVARADASLATLLGGLARLGLESRTLVVVTADHGEEMCEVDGCFTHGMHLRESLLRVPLVMAGAGLGRVGSAGAAARRVAAQVQHVDLAPTILEAAGLERPAGLEGQSLLPLARGEAPAAAAMHGRLAFAEVKEAEDDLSTGHWQFTKVAVRSPDFKLVATFSRGPDLFELFDLRREPFERGALTPGLQPGPRRDLLEALDRFLRRPRKGAARRNDLDERARRALESLGYVSPAGRPPR